MSLNPYKTLPSHHFWKKVVSEVSIADFDPVVRNSFYMSKTDKVATAGSCFAQHIAREVKARGFNYFDVETAHSLVPKKLYNKYSYDVFSARFGNIYSVRQLLQLFQRAFDEMRPEISFWKIGEDNYVDPYRPTIQSPGYINVFDLESDRNYHLSRVRKLFCEVDIFIFTLGLTEGWESIVDNSAYPVCPGLFDSEFSEAKYQFRNYTVSEVANDLQTFVNLLRNINPTCKIVLTVSPVPLIATYESNHVACATTYSKSVLRVAAEEVCRRNRDIDYFPSYEIIVGSYNRGAYFESDLRSVTPAGVEHVMNTSSVRLKSEQIQLVSVGRYF